MRPEPADLLSGLPRFLSLALALSPRFLNGRLPSTGFCFFRFFFDGVSEGTVTSSVRNGKSLFCLIFSVFLGFLDFCEFT